jgi:uncharacterized protein YbjT (DUF2867 family)
VVALRHPAAARRIIEFGGPESLSALEVVKRFEEAAGQKFEIESISEEALREQYEQASESMGKTFAGLMLGCATGDAMDMQPVVDTFGLELSSVDEYVRGVLGSSARA